jgi:hypothetical protein
VPAGELRIIRVGKFLGDNALEVGVNHRPVKRPPRTNNPVRERNPALSALGNLGKSGLTLAERQRPQIHTVSNQHVEGHIRRTPMPEQQPVEQRAPGVIKHDKLAIEHKARGQEIEHLLEPPHPVAVARNQPATNSVGHSVEAIELGFEHPIRMVERLCPQDRIDQ